VAKVAAICNTEFDQNTLSGRGGGGGGGERVAGREAEGATRGGWFTARRGGRQIEIA